MGLLQAGRQWLIEVLCFLFTFVLVDRLVLISPVCANPRSVGGCRKKRTTIPQSRTGGPLTVFVNLELNSKFTKTRTKDCYKSRLRHSVKYKQIRKYPFSFFLVSALNNQLVFRTFFVNNSDRAILFFKKSLVFFGFDKAITV